MSFKSARQRRRVMALLRAYNKYKDKPEHLMHWEGEQPQESFRTAYTISESSLEDKLIEISSAVAPSEKKGFKAPLLEDGTIAKRVPPNVVKEGIETVNRAASKYDVDVFGDVVKGIILRSTLRVKGLTAEASGICASSYPSDIIDINLPLLHDWSIKGGGRSDDLVAAGFDTAEKIMEHSVHHEVGHNIFRHLGVGTRDALLEKYSTGIPWSLARLFGETAYSSMTRYGSGLPNEWFAEHWAIYKVSPELLKKRMPDAYDFFSKIESKEISLTEKGEQETEGTRVMFHQQHRPKWMENETYTATRIPHSRLLEVLKIRKKRKPKPTN